MSCFLCNHPKGENYTADSLTQTYVFSCPKCGKFSITEESFEFIQNSPDKKFIIPKVASFIRNRKLYTDKLIMIFLKKVSRPNSITIDEIIDLFPYTINSKLDSAILNISKVNPLIGQEISLDLYDFPLFYCDINDEKTYSFMIETLLDNDYIEIYGNSIKTTVVEWFRLGGMRIRITPKGWNKIYSINSLNSYNSKNAFIAMSFNPSLEEVYTNGIYRAIKDCGYNPIRIDKSEHNEKICDKIISEIRRSKFLVCDFTDHKNGVYFEAGFGLGLNIPVIWSCKEDDITKTHFDTRQYNHILWKSVDELYQRLKNRIDATIL
jgi:hypothetical protein